MFGGGAYLAENPTKSDEYSKIFKEKYCQVPYQGLPAKQLFEEVEKIQKLKGLPYDSQALADEIYQNNKDQEFRMFVCRALVGSPYICFHPQYENISPDDKLPPEGHKYDSSVGESTRTLRIFLEEEFSHWINNIENKKLYEKHQQNIELYLKSILSKIPTSPEDIKILKIQVQQEEIKWTQIDMPEDLQAQLYLAKQISAILTAESKSLETIIKQIKTNPQVQQLRKNTLDLLDQWIKKAFLRDEKGQEILYIIKKYGAEAKFEKTESKHGKRISNYPYCVLIPKLQRYREFTIFDTNSIAADYIVSYKRITDVNDLKQPNPPNLDVLLEQLGSAQGRKNSSTKGDENSGKDEIYEPLSTHMFPLLEDLTKKFSLGQRVPRAKLETTNQFRMTPLVAASAEDNLEQVQLLLVSGANVNASCNGYSALSVAQSFIVVRYLIDYGANITSNVLRYWIQTNEEEKVLYLLDHGVQLNTDSKPILNSLPHSGNLVILKYLLDHDVDPNRKDNNGTPEWISMNPRTVETLKLLEQYEVDLNAKAGGLSFLHHCAYACNQSLVEYLLLKGFNINELDNSGQTPLDHIVKPVSSSSRITPEKFNFIIFMIQKGAQQKNIRENPSLSLSELAMECIHGDIKTVAQLLERGADINDQKNLIGATPLHLVCSIGNTHLVQLLVEKKAIIRPNINGDTPFLIAASAGNVQVMDILLQKKAFIHELNQNQQTALILATISSKFEAVSFLITKKHGLELQDSVGKTALTYACEKNFVEIAKLLIEKGANPNHQDQGGHILRYCFQYPQLLRLLLENGVDLNEPSGISFLTSTISLEAIKLLLEKGANPNPKSCFDNMPLTYACMKRQLDVVKLLIEAGADINITDQRGNFLLDRVDDNCHAIKRYLKMKGARSSNKKV